MSEREFQDQVVELLGYHGLISYHTYRSDRSEPGFPDLCIVGANGVAYRELKTEKGRVSPDQQFWLDALTEAGQDADVWRPHQLATDVLALSRQLGRLQTTRPVVKVKPRRRPGKVH